jgi:hypothetical protein
MARRAVLTRAIAPQFFAVLDEVALRRPVGELGVMRRQLAHLLNVAEQPHVTLRVVPLAARLPTPAYSAAQPCREYAPHDRQEPEPH